MNVQTEKNNRHKYSLYLNFNSKENKKGDRNFNFTMKILQETPFYHGDAISRYFTEIIR